MKKQSLVLFQIVFSLLCLMVALSFVEPKTVSKAWASADPFMLVLTFVLMPPAVLSRAFRWWYILRRNHITVPLATMGRVTFIGMALNLMLPGGMGDVARSYYGWVFAGNKEAMLASAIVDKVIALFTLCLLGAICALLTGFYRLFVVSILLSISLFVLLALPRLVPWWLVSYVFKRVLNKDFDRERLKHTFHLDRHTCVGSIVISLIAWMITNAMYYCAFRAFTEEVSLAYVYSIAPLINLARVVPISVSGLGSVDLLIIFLLGEIGVGESISMMASLTVDTSLIVLPGVVGALLLATCRTACPNSYTRSLSMDQRPSSEAL